MYVYSDEDNVPMTYDFLLEYADSITAIINERLFKETGILEIKTTGRRNKYGRGPGAK